LASELGGPERALAIPTDLTASGRARGLVQAAAAHFGRLDGLVNNAGLFAGGELAAIDPDHLRRCWELNVLALLEATQAAVPHLRRTRGLIVNVSSPSAFLGLPRLAPYAITKAAVSALSESLRRELLPDGIRVLVAYPGLTESDLGATALGEVSPYARRRWRPRPRPAAPVAAEIVEAIRRDRREVWTTSPLERLATMAYGLARRLAPSLLDRVIARLA
jgi:NAD(P)-dependent dehydrogenase (short-subunit alcohol dehydrogenase family)